MEKISDDEFTEESSGINDNDVLTDNEDSIYINTDKNSPAKRYVDSQLKRKHEYDDTQVFGSIDLLPLPLPLSIQLEGKADSEKPSLVPIKSKNDNSDLLLKKNIRGNKYNIDPTNKRQKMEDIQGTQYRDTWVNESTPNKIEDLCIHKKKLDDLKIKLEDLLYRRTDSRILVVSGPSGSGKSTSVKVMANSIMKQKISKLKQQIIGSEISDNLNSTNYIVEFNILKNSHGGNSSVTYFGEFLEQCKLLTGLNEKCIVIEELPNLFHKGTHVNFQNSIKKWLDSDINFQLPPLVICITEFDIENDLDWNNGTNFTIDNTVKVETVLGYKVMQYQNIGWEIIRFNRVAKTFLKKALLRVLSLEDVYRNKLVDQKIDGLSILGDLRNAINALEFWYKFQRQSIKEDNNFESIDGKETGLDIFHSIGKIIYGSKHQIEEFEDFKKRHNLKIKKYQVRSDIVTVDNVSSEIMSHLIRFNLCCLENYCMIDPPICEDLDKLMDVLSISDDAIRRSNSYNYSKVLQNTSFYSCLGIRTYCEKLKLKKDSGGHVSINKKKNVIFSRDSKLRRKLQEVNKEINEFQKRRQKRMFYLKNYNNLNRLESITIDGFYQSNIFSSFKFKYKRYTQGYTSDGKIQRLGGIFNNSITADDVFKAEDENIHDVDNNVNVEMDLNTRLKALEEEYFGVVPVEHDSGMEEISGGELDSDPIESSSDEGDIGRINDEEEDVFSDDSAVLNELF